MISNAGLLLASIAAACLFFHPRFLRARLWRATVTPLASIIGSGFLVVGPILSDQFSSRAWMAMVALCAVGYFYGAVMRHNIRFTEPEIGHLPVHAALVERASDLTLSLAYFVSVAYYLNLFAAFGLRIVGIEDQYVVRLIASAAIAAAGGIGFLGGLRALERVEVGAVGLKLAVIAGILVALALFAQLGQADWIESIPKAGVGKYETLLGLVILVQGFETSRYLGAEYDTETRVRTMRYAQWISTAVYIGFVFLVTHLFRDSQAANGGETAIIDMLQPIGVAVAPLLIAAALASQSSAAVADMNGASGLLAETTRGRLSVNFGSVATAVAAIAITWSANIYEIITYASKAFVIYYGLQSLQAVLSSLRHHRKAEAAFFTLGIMLAFAVVTLGKPAAG